MDFVDWCDAYAYCKGVGKRLCGKIGGGTNAYADYASATLSQWYAACTSNGANDYPYGDTYAEKTCNGYDYWDRDSTTYTTLAVGTLTSCQSGASGYSGVYDLSGNVYEWEDSCDTNATGQSANCRPRGGSFTSNSSYLACAVASGYIRFDANLNIGFRCCAP